MAAIATSLSSSVILNDGVRMPMFGMGLFRSQAGGDTEAICKFGLQNGYRMIDTAQFYGNEEDVGKAVRSCGIPREEIFITSKVFENGAANARKGVSDSLKKLDIGYIDLYLIHSPRDGKIVETYDVLMEFKEKGLIKSVGVSNFNVQHLEGLRRAGRPTPSVNQIELHPWQHKVKVVEYCRQHNIAITGFCPLFRGENFDDLDVRRMARKYRKTPAQVLIRYGVQNGFITIPKSSRPERVLENAEVFSWSIDQEDMQKLANFPEALCSWDVFSLPWLD